MTLPQSRLAVSIYWETLSPKRINTPKYTQLVIRKCSISASPIRSVGFGAAHHNPLSFIA